MELPDFLKVLSGEVDLEAEQMEFLRAWKERVVGNDDDGGPHDVVAECDDEEPPDELVGLDGDGKDDVYVSVVQARPGATWTDEQRMLRDGMRRSLAFAQMSRFRVDLSHDEFVAAIGIVTRLELGLISWFGGAGPGPERELGRLPEVAGDGAPDSPSPVGGGRRMPRSSAASRGSSTGFWGAAGWAARRCTRRWWRRPTGW